MHRHQIRQSKSRFAEVPLFEFKALNFPLAAFQAHALDKNDEARSKKEMLLLVKTLNKNRDEAVRLVEERLDRQFDRCWPEFWNPYVQLCEKHAHAKKPHTAAKATVTNEEILTEMRSAFRQFADVLTEIRRNSVIVPPVEQPAELQQLTVVCPFCQGGNEVLILDRAGETKPTICSNCGGRFNVHMNREHSVLVRGILPPASTPSPVIRTQQPTKSENVQCPTCHESLIIELPERAGETRSRFCPKCGNIHGVINNAA
jgi:DNA-directed RNA polymerase subunit M/transcription elongation factor TFIIS